MMNVRYLILVFVAIAFGWMSLAGAGPLSSPDMRAMTTRDHDGSTDDYTPCEMTAKVAKKACKYDVRDDFFTQMGNCLNLSDPAEADECRAEAADVRDEENELCGDRKEARLDVCDLLEEDLYDPEIDPAFFLSPGEIAADPNPYFPLVPGNIWIYENEDETITVTVLDETIEILGVICVVVRDLVTEDGEAIEDTFDWYTQDLDGNVWYFGEIAKNFEDGMLSDLEGSWRAGRDYAKPGMLIPAAPYPGQAYRQEFLLREAEDVAEVVSITASESVDLVDCEDECLQTLEGTPIEPGFAEHKFYKADIGLILEVDLEEGGRTELVEFTDASAE